MFFGGHFPSPSSFRDAKAYVILCVCILFGMWFWSGHGQNCPFNADVSGPCLRSSDTDFQLTKKIAGLEANNHEWGDKLRVPGWFKLSLQRFSASSARRRLLAPVQHFVFVGIMKGDGSLEADFISTGDFGDDEKKQKDTYTSSMSRLPMIIPRNQESDKVKTYRFEDMKDFIPCLDNVSAIKRVPSASKGEQWERHCPHKSSQMCCLIATPTSYKTPIIWPDSKDEVWLSNVPRPRPTHKDVNETWLIVQKDKFKFPVSGSHFPHGVDGYLDHLAQVVPGLAFGTQTRVALDVGCGVANWGAYLVDRDVLPLSIAPKDVHRNEVQFALERGVPAMVAVLASRRLPYPSQAFDLIHCSGCEIEWTKDGGILLLEVDRLLRAGGYFAWAAKPPFLKPSKRNQQALYDMEDLTNRVCWTLVAKTRYVAVWQKAIDNSCYLGRALEALPPMCDPNDDPNAVWYVPLKPCITWLPIRITNGSVANWPERLSIPPERLFLTQLNADVARPEVFISQQRYWNEVVDSYLRGLGLKQQNVRNVMDMRAGFGGFAASFVEQKMNLWVLNVVPTSGPNTLPVIYDRGLIGVAHDWCEPFDTYPRTYDLVHAAGLFTAEEKRCNIARIFVRETRKMVERVNDLAMSVRWTTKILETESGPYGKDKLLVCIKHKWHA